MAPVVDRPIVHFTPVDNLPGALQRGCLIADSVVQSLSIDIRECGDVAIKQRRRTMPVHVNPLGCVGDYVPFYFAPRSPIMYKIWRGISLHAPMVPLRRVTYLLGSADIHQDHDLDTSCSAMVQGDTRFERSRFYHSFIQIFFPSARHDMVAVPEVGHDYDAMFNSAQGKAAIFRDW